MEEIRNYALMCWGGVVSIWNWLVDGTTGSPQQLVSFIVGVLTIALLIKQLRTKEKTEGISHTEE